MSSDSSASGRGTALRAVDLGKRYSIGETGGFFRYRSLRDEISSGIRRRLQRETDETRELWALRHIDFEIAQGEAVGVIGHNGAGKSTLFKVLSQITPPTEGRAEVTGRLGSLLEVGTGFHPELTGRENVFLSGAVLGMRSTEIRMKLDEIVDFAGVERFLETPVKRYSSGMYMRLAFAVAAHLEPEILLVDEVLSVGDAKFQQKCLGKMAEVGASGRTVLFVSHSMPAVLRLCDRVLLLEHGRLIDDGPPAQIVRSYLESGLGSGAEMHWPDLAGAPGNRRVRLKSVRVLDHEGKVSEELDIRRPTNIEVEYWNLEPSDEDHLTCNIHIMNEEGVQLLASADFNNLDWRDRRREVGLVQATCHVPGNFFAEGHFYVTVNVSSLSPPQVHVSAKDAVSFQVVDRSTGDGARGLMVDDWPGVVRPKLDWSIEQDSSPTARATLDATRSLE